MQRVLSLALISVLASVAFVAIAQDRPTPLDPTHPVARPDAAALSPLDRARRAKVIAHVYEHDVTVAEVEDALAAQSPFLRARYAQPEHMHELVENLIRFQLLAHEAEKRGLGTNPVVAHSVAQNAVQALVKAVVDDRVTLASVTDADVQAYYDAHPDEFHHPEMRRASHILVATREEALALVPQARTADLATFRQLVTQHSLDAETKLRGGDLRFFPRQPPAQPVEGDDAAPDQALIAAAFALHEIGDVSDPVAVGTEWSVLKLTGLRPEETRRPADAAPGIRMRLWRERRQTALDTLVTQLRERYHPEIHAERVDPIHLDALPPGAGMPGFPPGGAAGGTGAAPTKQGTKATGGAGGSH